MSLLCMGDLFLAVQYRLYPHDLFTAVLLFNRSDVLSEHSDGFV